MGILWTCPVAAPFNGWNAKGQRGYVSVFTHSQQRKQASRNPICQQQHTEGRLTGLNSSINWKSKHNYLYRSQQIRPLVCRKWTFQAFDNYHKLCIHTFFGTQISRRAYFSGQSYIASSQKISFFDGFEGGFNFRTLQPNGLLFYYASGVSICFLWWKLLCANCFVY